MKNVKRAQSFTRIEPLIVIAIIGILAAVLIPNLLGAQKRAYNTGATACGRSLQTAMAAYYIDKNTYVGATPSKIMEDTSSGCSNNNVNIGTTTQSDYTFTVSNTRGSKTYIITPSTISGS